MNKNDFKLRLYEELEGISANEKSRILDYFDELISDAVEDGCDEEVFISGLGDVKAIVKKVIAEQRIRYAKENPGISSGFKALTAVFALCALPLALPLGIGVVGVVVSIIATVVGIVVSIVGSVIGLTFGGIGFGIGGLFGLIGGIIGGVFKLIFSVIKLPFAVIGGTVSLGGELISIGITILMIVIFIKLIQFGLKFIGYILNLITNSVYKRKGN